MIRLEIPAQVMLPVEQVVIGACTPSSPSRFWNFSKY